MLMPRLRIVDKLPQWITSSDKAAYHPWTGTIWIATSQCKSRWDFLKSLGHELGHHLIEILVPKPDGSCGGTNGLSTNKGSGE